MILYKKTIVLTSIINNLIRYGRSFLLNYKNFYNLIANIKLFVVKLYIDLQVYGIRTHQLSLHPIIFQQLNQ